MLNGIPLGSAQEGQDHQRLAVDSGSGADLICLYEIELRPLWISLVEIDSSNPILAWKQKWRLLLRQAGRLLVIPQRRGGVAVTQVDLPEQISGTAR